jgi:hypothetical protein
MVDWEKKYGKDFTSTTKFNELIEGISGAVLKTTKPKSRQTRRGGGASFERASSSSSQTNQLVAMAPLEEQMTTSTHIISVNNTNTIPIPVSTDSSGETGRSSDPFKQLHLASIS